MLRPHNAHLPELHHAVGAHPASANDVLHADHSDGFGIMARGMGGHHKPIAASDQARPVSSSMATAVDATRLFGSRRDAK